MRKSNRKIVQIFSLLCVAVLLAIMLPISAFAGQKTVTVAYIDYNNFIVKQSDST